MLFEKFTSADLSQIAREKSCDYLLIVHMYMQKFDLPFLFYVSPFVIVWGAGGGGREPGRTWDGRGTGDGRRKGVLGIKLKKNSITSCQTGNLSKSLTS